MQKYLRSKRKETPYEGAEQFLKRELFRGDQPDNELSCNLVSEASAAKCLVEYKATNLLKPLTKSIAGFFLPPVLAYGPDLLNEGYFDLVKKTHHCLKGTDGLSSISELGYKHCDVCLSKEQIWAFIDSQEKLGNAEWKSFLAANGDWAQKLDSYRDQKKDAALKEWTSFGGGSFKDASINKLLKLDAVKTLELLNKIVDAEALPESEIERVRKFLPGQDS